MVCLAYIYTGEIDENGEIVDDSEVLWVSQPNDDFRKPIPREGELVVLHPRDLCPDATVLPEVAGVIHIDIPSSIEIVVGIRDDYEDDDENTSRLTGQELVKWLKEHRFNPLPKSDWGAYFGVLQLNDIMAARAGHPLK